MSSPTHSSDFRRRFLTTALEHKALAFGEFTTKAGRLSPYFFNSGRLDTGHGLAEAGRCFAAALLASGIEFDMVFGPAYKGIPLVSALSIGLAEAGRSVPYCFDRKETKDHGEGGRFVGAPLKGKVVIVDDVITNGAAKRESIEMIRSQGAEPAAVLIMLDRMERGNGSKSAVQELQDDFGLPVIAIASLKDVLALVTEDSSLAAYKEKVEAYRQEYGVAS